MQRDIQIVVKDRVATTVGQPVIVCGNRDYTVTFSFDDEWENSGAKTARFKYLTEEGMKHQDVGLTGNKVQVPMLSNIREVEVGVYAGNLVTTTGAPIRCQPSILCDSGEGDDAAGGGNNGATVWPMPNININDIVIDKVLSNTSVYSPETAPTELWVYGSRLDTDGNTTSDNSWCITPHLEVTSAWDYLLGYRSDNFVYLYDESKSFIGFFDMRDLEEPILKLPEACRYIRLNVLVPYIEGEKATLEQTVEAFNNEFKIYPYNAYQLKDNVLVSAIGYLNVLATENDGNLVDAINELYFDMLALWNWVDNKVPDNMDDKFTEIKDKMLVEADIPEIAQQAADLIDASLLSLLGTGVLE